MQILPNSDNLVYKIGKYVRRFCKICASSNIDNYVESTGGKADKYAEMICNIPSCVIEAAAKRSGGDNFSANIMTDNMRMFFGLLRYGI
jgi:hypothetical protein